MNSTRKLDHSSQNSDSKPDISTLRVAQSELVSGNTAGTVYMRLSPGSVAFPQDRSSVQKKLSTQIRQAILDESASPSGSSK